MVWRKFDAIFISPRCQAFTTKPLYHLCPGPCPGLRYCSSIVIVYFECYVRRGAALLAAVSVFLEMPMCRRAVEGAHKHPDLRLWVIQYRVKYKRSVLCLRSQIRSLNPTAVIDCSTRQPDTCWFGVVLGELNVLLWLWLWKIYFYLSMHGSYLITQGKDFVMRVETDWDYPWIPEFVFRRGLNMWKYVFKEIVCELAQWDRITTRLDNDSNNSIQLCW